MRYGRKNGKGSSKSLLRRRRRRAASRRLALYPTPEFKTHFFNQEGNVGQCNGLEHNGAFGIRVDPVIGHGFGGGSRIGNWVTLKSMFFDFHFKNQVNATLTNRLIVDVWLKDKGQLIDPHPYVDGHTHPLTGLGDFRERQQIAAYIFENNYLVSSPTTPQFSYRDGFGSGTVDDDGTNIASKGPAPDDADAQWNTIDIGSRRNERNSNQFKLLARHLVTIPG
ncbi:MAG: hypothetical protein ACO33E_04190, partial [Aquiluna sp.]